MRKARWKKRAPGELTIYEQAWQDHLRSNHPDLKVFHEAIKFKLADRTYYTPDFIVLQPDGTIEAHEVKGSWRAPNQEDSRVKLKVTAEQFWWIDFVSIECKQIAKKNGGGWQFKKTTF